ncbi:MAG TPA: glycoside hydrolase family 1 protein [Verrucomicrobiae bacterium]|nr:glycoside hydrolase family 1 protein [Verrucomicrobiae bacterium]
MSQKQLPLQFPKKFLWGTSVSAHQVEGGTDNQWTRWELENAKSLAKQAEYKQTWLPRWDEIQQQATNPDNYISGKAVDHFHNYEEDFRLLKKMHMNAFRFSIEWSRIEPEEGKWSPEGITFYKEYIAALKAKEIEPIMTLFHFTLPAWFEEKGGFEKRANNKYFVRFAEKVLSELGQHVRYVITMNEPEVYVYQGWRDGSWPPNKTSKWPALKVYLNLVAAHKKVAKLAHGMSRRFKVGLSTNAAHHYPGDDAWLTRLTAQLAQKGDDLFLRLTRRHLDWIGLNYYFANRYYGYRAHNPEDKLSDLGWAMEPDKIQDVVERLYVNFGVPIMITENGLADEKDEHRQWWITQTLLALHKAQASGVKLLGYLHWSLLDNFEWAYGKWPRFGLFAVDYKTGARTPRKSAAWFALVVKRLRDKK